MTIDEQAAIAAQAQKDIVRALRMLGADAAFCALAIRVEGEQRVVLLASGSPVGGVRELVSEAAKAAAEYALTGGPSAPAPGSLN